MTEDERDALVEELCDRLWDMPVLLDTTRPQRAMIAEEACLPTIDRLLAAHDLDALLDSVDGIITWTAKWNHPDGGSHCEITLMTDDGHFDGMGQDYMDAIRDAVAKATTTQEGTRNG